MNVNNNHPGCLLEDLDHWAPLAAHRTWCSRSDLTSFLQAILIQLPQFMSPVVLDHSYTSKSFGELFLNAKAWILPQIS